MCIRHELSPAVQISAPLPSTLRILSPSIAVDVSEFLIAKVPPKPQHCSASGSSTSSRPCTCPQQPDRLVANPQHPQRVAGRVIGHLVREVRPDVCHAEHVHQELRQLVGLGRDRLHALDQPR